MRVMFASNWAAFCSAGCGISSDIKAYVVGSGGTPPVLDTIPPAAVKDLRGK
jgi:hypothetical protein